MKFGQLVIGLLLGALLGFGVTKFVSKEKGIDASLLLLNGTGLIAWML